MDRSNKKKTLKVLFWCRDNESSDHQVPSILVTLDTWRFGSWSVRLTDTVRHVEGLVAVVEGGGGGAAPAVLAAAAVPAPALHHQVSLSYGAGHRTVGFMVLRCQDGLIFVRGKLALINTNCNHVISQMINESDRDDTDSR